MGPHSWEPPGAASKQKLRDPLPLVKSLTYTDEQLAARQRLAARPKDRRLRCTLDTATQRVLAAAQTRSHLAVFEAVDAARLDGVEATGGMMKALLGPALRLACCLDDFAVLKAVLSCAPQADVEDAGWLEEALIACASTNSWMCFKVLLQYVGDGDGGVGGGGLTPANQGHCH